MIIDYKYTLTMSDLKNGILHEDFYKCENIGKWDSAYDDEISRINKNGLFKEFIKDVYDDLKDYYDYKDDNEIIKEIDFIKVMYNLFNDENYMSNDYINQKMYEAEIDRIIDVKDSLSNESNYLKICKPTETLKQVGLDDNLITMKRGKVRICCKDKELGGHGINRQTLYNLPKLFENPAIIVKSQKDEKSIIVFLNDIDNEKNPIMASIKPDEKGTYDFEQIDTNLLTSIYGRENFSKFLNDNKDKILFTDELVIKDLEVKTSMKIFNKENENLLEQQQ